jgi:hypothetical protein
MRLSIIWFGPELFSLRFVPHLLFHEITEIGATSVLRAVISDLAQSAS